MAIVLGAGFDIARTRPPHVWIRRCASLAPVALAAAVALVLMAPVVSLVFGLRVFVVTSGSMVPLAQTGDAILLREVAPDDVHVGDVITFRPLREGGVRTHRVVSLHEVEGAGLHFRTKGDANDEPDANLVPAANVLGRVVKVVPRIGRQYLWATTPAGRLVLVGIPATLLIVRELWWLAAPRSVIVRRRVRRARGRSRARVATLTIAAVAGAGIAGPTAARFVDSTPVAANTVSSGQVNAPTNLNGSAQLVPCRVNLTWSAPASGLTPDGYDILRATTSGGPYSLRKHVTATSGTDDSGPLGALTTYYYVVRSTRSAWKSANSNEKAITTVLCAL